MKLQISLSSSMEMYHGSQHSEVNFKAVNLLFVTKSIEVARQYAEGKVHFTGKLNGSTLSHGSSLYRLVIAPHRIFDMRKAECRDDYVALRKENPDLELPNIKSEGFIMSHTGLPGYGHIRGMRDMLTDKGYDCMYVDEGSQGISIAIFKSSVILNSEKIK